MNESEVFIQYAASAIVVEAKTPRSATTLARALILKTAILSVEEVYCVVWLTTEGGQEMRNEGTKQS